MTEEIRKLYELEGIKKEFYLEEVDGFMVIKNDNLIENSFRLEESICSEQSLKFGCCEAAKLEFECFDIPNIKGKKFNVRMELGKNYTKCNRALGTSSSKKDILKVSEETSRTLELYKIARTDSVFQTYTISFCYWNRYLQEGKREKEQIVLFIENDTERQIISREFEKEPIYEYEMEITFQMLIKNPKRIMLSFENYIGTLTIWKFKLETGDKKTPWSLAPENTGQKITAYWMPLGIFKVESCQRMNNMRKRKVVAYDAMTELDQDGGSFLRRYFSYNYEFHLDSLFTAVLSYFDFEISMKKEKVLENDLKGEEENLSLEGYQVFFDYMKSDTSRIPADSSKKYIITSEAFSKKNLNALLKEYPANANFIKVLSVQEYDGNQNKIRNTKRMFGEMFCLDKRTTAIEIRVAVRFERDGKNYSISQKQTLWQCEEHALDITDSEFEIEKQGALFDSDEKVTIREIIKGILELSGAFGRIDKNGTFEVVKMQEKSVYPSYTLYPSEKLYPLGTMEKISRSKYKSLWYEEYRVQPFGKIQIKNSSGEEVLKAEYEAEKNKNTYVVENNFICDHFIINKINYEKILKEMYEKIKDCTYVPFKLQTKGKPYLMPGQRITILTKEGGLETVILKRTLKGTFSLTDQYTAEGREREEELENVVYQEG